MVTTWALIRGTVIGVFVGTLWALGLMMGLILMGLAIPLMLPWAVISSVRKTWRNQDLRFQIEKARAIREVEAGR